MYEIKFINPYQVYKRTRRKSRSSWDKAVNLANRLEQDGYQVIDIDIS